MKGVNKKLLNDLGRKLPVVSNINFIIILTALIIFSLSYGKGPEFNFKEFINISILTAIVVIFVCGILPQVISSIINKTTEDAAKLSEDYISIIKRYCREKMINVNGVLLPVISLCERKLTEPAFEFEIANDNYLNKYKLPSQVAVNSKTLFKAHRHSQVYNNINIRLDDFTCEDNKIKLLYSKTTYYDSLLTNRAMDYNFSEGRNVRDIYEPGPFLSSFNDSKLSNHIGFNGFVELGDNSIIFVHRGKGVSIAKDTWAPSITAPLRTAYALNKTQQLTQRGFSDAIRNEIFNELRIKIPEFKNLSKNIFAFYRDVVEGGKPQFVFHYRTDLFKTSQEYIEYFKECLVMENKGKDLSKIKGYDGNHFAFFTIDELKTFEFGIDYMKSSAGKVYKMVPSALASIIFLLNANKSN